MSYAMQRYMGGNADALAAVADGHRNAGEIYAFDDWTIADRLNVTYGTRYARYDYLANENLLSPKASVTVTPLPDASLRVRGTVSHRELAPGASMEFGQSGSQPTLCSRRALYSVRFGTILEQDS
jgi:outer membrane receptor protein involved in Fe transport